jgi:hypothetical protein
MESAANYQHIVYQIYFIRQEHSMLHCTSAVCDVHTLELLLVMPCIDQFLFLTHTLGHLQVRWRHCRQHQLSHSMPKRPVDGRAGLLAAE